jgi:hypothetical protein
MILNLSQSLFCQQRSWVNIDEVQPLQQTNKEEVIWGQLSGETNFCSEVDS